MATWNSRGLRGSTLEEFINHTNERYSEMGLALIQKIPTPITPVKIDQENRHITLAYFDKISTVDYIGAVQGIPVCFDAKECRADTFPLQNVHAHQMDFMEKFEKQGGISFLLIYFSTRDELYYMRYEQITRNRYRKVILPFLKKEDANVHEKFWKFSKILSEYSDYVDREAARAFQKVYHDLTLCIPKYLELEPLLQERVIYKMLEEVYQDDLMLLGDKHVNLIRDLITSRKSNAFLYLPNNVKVVKSYEQLKIVVETGEVASYEIEINDYAILPNGKHLEVVPAWDENGNDVCRLSSSDVTLPLYVRTRNHGDKMEMKGTNGHRKVKDIMIDAKVPLEERELWPVVVDSKGVIVWLPGLKKSKFNLSKNENCDIIIRYY